MNGKLIVLEAERRRSQDFWRIILLKGEKTSCMFLFLIMEVLHRHW